MIVLNENQLNTPLRSQGINFSGWFMVGWDIWQGQE
jgi:hypothetical protein